MFVCCSVFHVWVLFLSVFSAYELILTHLLSDCAQLRLFSIAFTLILHVH